MTTHVGPYEILQRIAIGGMAEIYLAKQTSIAGFERKVVLKRVLPEYASDPMFIESFLAEGRLSGLLTHPNIVQVIELGQIDETYFIALEFIDGMDASTLLAFTRGTHTLLPVGVALRIACDMLTGLDFAHNLTDEAGATLGLIHRDVSPSNLLIAFNGVSKVVDFGIAKATARLESKTKTGVIKGKLSYFAPELITRTGKADKRIDVFAAGVVLYELLTNRHPFRGDGEMDTLHAIVNEPPPSFEMVGASAVPSAWQAVVERALAKDPNQRFESCAAFLQAIESTAAATGLRLSSHEVRDYLRLNRSKIDELLAKRRGTSVQNQGFTAPAAEQPAENPTRPIAIKPKTEATQPSEPGAVRAPAAEAPRQEPTVAVAEDKGSTPLMAIVGITVVVLLLGTMWLVGGSLNEPTRKADTQPMVYQPQTPPVVERSDLSKRNKTALSGSAFAVEQASFTKSALATGEAQGFSLRTSAPGICVRIRDHAAEKQLQSQLYLPVLRAGTTYHITGHLSRAPAELWIETDDKSRGRIGVKTVKTPGEVQLEIPRGTLQTGVHELRFMISRNRKTVAIPWHVRVASGEQVATRASDEDGDCATVGEGDCDDRKEDVSRYELERCDNGIDDNCDGKIDCAEAKPR